MNRFHASLILLLLSVAACTQEAAPVDYRGSRFYGREHEQALDRPDHETYSEDSPRYKPGYARPVEKAAVPTVAEADLPPPTETPASRNPAFPPPPAPQGSLSLSERELPPPTATDSAQSLQEKQLAIAPATAPAAASTPAAAAPANTAPAATATSFIWPVTGGSILSHFGPRPGHKANDGINISAGDGEPIWASADGTVVYAGNELKGYGNMVIIRHPNGFMTAYAHASSIGVVKGDNVKQGQVIAYVGTSGGVKEPQIHFAIRNGKTPVDPEQYLPAGGAN